MSRRERPLLDDVKNEIGAMGSDLRESLLLRWQLARTEAEADLRSIKQLAVVLAIAIVMALSAVPILLVCLARLLDGWLGVPNTAWLAIFGLGLLIGGATAGHFGWHRFRNRFIGLQQTLEELREDIVWLQEWTKREDADEDG